MIEAEIPENEASRVAALLAYDVLDTEPEQAYDDLTRIASLICDTPIALVSLVDSDRQWFKSRHGLDATETPRSVAFCSHAILEPEQPLIVNDSFEDERFHDNPIVVGEPRVRFYAGFPLAKENGLAVGTLCVIDHEPRELTKEQIQTLSALARQTVSQLELRKSNLELGSKTIELQRANEDLQQFTSVAAHDLREPLRKLSSFSELLRCDMGDDLPARASEDLEHIVSSSQQMDQLVTSLLELSRAGAGQIANDEVELSDCATFAVDALHSIVEESNPKIEIDLHSSVLGDGVLLTQVFQNLISNSIKFCEERPSIRITSDIEDGVSVVSVEDNGIGMEPRFAEKIFEPFRRLHSRQEFEGTGIGLSLTRKIIERHGGRIWVESKLGQGSTFRFTLAGMRPSKRSSLAA